MFCPAVSVTGVGFDCEVEGFAGRCRRGDDPTRNCEPPSNRPSETVLSTFPTVTQIRSSLCADVGSPTRSDSKAVTVLGDLEDAEAGAGVEPGVAVGKRCEGVDEVIFGPEVTAVFQVGAGHLLVLASDLAEWRRRVDSDVGSLECLRQQSLVAVGFLL